MMKSALGVFWVLAGMLTLTLSAAPERRLPKRPPERNDIRMSFSPAEKVWIRDGLKAAFVRERLAVALTELTDGRDGRAPDAEMFQAVRREIRSFHNYPFFEYDTNLSTPWLVGIEKKFEMLQSIRLRLLDHEAQKNPGNPNYRKWADDFAVRLNALKKDLDTPKAATSPRSGNIAAAREKALKQLRQAERQNQPPAAGRRTE